MRDLVKGIKGVGNAVAVGVARRRQHAVRLHHAVVERRRRNDAAKTRRLKHHRRRVRHRRRNHNLALRRRRQTARLDRYSQCIGRAAHQHIHHLAAARHFRNAQHRRYPRRIRRQSDHLGARRKTQRIVSRHRLCRCHRMPQRCAACQVGDDEDTGGIRLRLKRHAVIA